MLPAKPAADEAPAVAPVRALRTWARTTTIEDHHRRRRTPARPPLTTTDSRRLDRRRRGGWMARERWGRGGSDTEVQGLGRKSNGRRMAQGVICETDRVVVGRLSAKCVHLCSRPSDAHSKNLIGISIVSTGCLVCIRYAYCIETFKPTPNLLT